MSKFVHMELNTSDTKAAKKFYKGLFGWKVTDMKMGDGSVYSMVEGPEGGFDPIPKGMYWALSTLTTVGYGDVVPTSIPGRMLASLVMVLGYGVIAVPGGIVSSDIAQTVEAYRKRLVCGSCEARGHAADSRFCRRCGAPLTVGESLTSSGSVPVVKLPPGDA